MKAAPKHPDTPEPPVHIAIIMDGNGRWARARGKPRSAGHLQGAEAVRTAIKAAKDLGVSYLTLYGFSLENWKRPPTEIRQLMSLLRLYLRRETEELAKNGVRMRFIGDRSLLAPEIVALMETMEERTKANNTLNVIMAMSYGARQEITTAARAMARKVRDGVLAPEDIDEREITRNLYTADIPDPDLVIRTSGEQRVSNFLLWQLAYAELLFTETLWPDFSRDELKKAIIEFQSRERRYGASVG